MCDEDNHAQPVGQYHALVSGGGSGGHVFPALAVAETLRERGWRVSYAGSAQGPEARLVPARGMTFHPLPARPVVGRGVLGKVAALGTMMRSAFYARGLIRRETVDVVVGTGGYVAVPAVVGARLARRPALIVEPNAQAGLANRALSRLADEAALAYGTTAPSLRCASTVTGVPVRRAFFDVGALPSRPPLRLLVLGGSQGSRQLNLLVPAALRLLGDDCPVSVLHQSGPRRRAEAEDAYRTAGVTGGIEIVAFVDDMPREMASSHLILSRAGAITLAELCAAGRPSVLIPLGLAGGHQADNARALEAAGAARVLAGADATAKRLADALRGLLDPPAGDLLASMATAARSLARPDAAAAIADRVARLAERRAG